MNKSGVYFGTVPYVLTVLAEFSSFYEQEPNNDFSDSQPIEINRNYNGILSDSDVNNGDPDYYSFEIPDTGNVKISVTRALAGDYPPYRVALYPSQDPQFISDDDLITDELLRESQPFLELELSAGKYILIVYRHSARAYEVEYVLNINANSASIPSDASGFWWEPAKSGQGVSLVDNSNSLSGAWYTYDESGNGMWLVFDGSLNGTKMETDLVRFTGPSLGANWNPDEVASSVVGSVTIDFTSSRSATMTFNVTGKTGTLNLVPFGR